MVQNKLALYLSAMEVNETDLAILEFAGLKDINPICYKEKGMMREIFSHNPDNVIIIWDNVHSNDDDIYRVLRAEGYSFIMYNDIKLAVRTIKEVQKAFEGKED